MREPSTWYLDLKKAWDKYNSIGLQPVDPDYRQLRLRWLAYAEYCDLRDKRPSGSTRAHYEKMGIV